MSVIEEPGLEDVEREYPEWLVWKGADQMCHALLKSGAVLTVRGEDPVDLRDQIIRAQAFRQGL